jgi:hypothetical protein
MKENKSTGSSRLWISGGVCIAIALLISIFMENVEIGLVVGLILGIVGGSLFGRGGRS